MARPIERLLVIGMAPGRLARALAVGALIGSMPLPWGTSLICLASALALRLNPLAVEVGNLAAWPLQIVLAIPYFWLGTAWFRGVLPPDASPPTWDCLFTNPLQTLRAWVLANGAALAVWTISTPILFPIFHFASRRLVAAFDPAARRKKRSPKDPDVRRGTK